MSFLKSKDIGNEGELHLIKQLKDIGVGAEQAFPGKRFSDYDLTSNVGGTEITFEVKNDVYALRSGNVALEVFNTKKNELSGIFGTKADVWAHIVGVNTWLAPVSALLDWIDEVKPHRIIESGGDNNAMLHLYRCDVFYGAKFCTLLNDYTTKHDFTKWLKKWKIIT